MVDNISLGKGRKAQQLDLAKMQQGGIIREAKNEKNESIFSDDEKKIFDAADKNGGKANGVLDKEELNKFLEDLKAAAGNGRLSKREANKFLKEHGLKDVDPKTLFSFVDKISQSSENIKSCQMDAEGNIIIEYNDDKTETINSENQTSTIQSNDGKITEEYNAARELTKKTVKENETDSTTTEYSGVDKDGNPIRTKETVISEKEVEDPSKKEKTTTTTTFENGKKKVITTSKDSGFSIITTLDENEKPKTEVETQGKYTEIHREYVDGNKNPRETKRFENKGLDIQKEYTYEYSEDGTEVKESISELGGTKNTVTIKKDDVLISKDITEPDKTTKVTQNKEGGYTEEITEGTTVTQNELNSEMKRLSQTKQVGTKQYQLTYDGSGNTAGIIVQNGESPAAIAKKFGVPLDKLREANADKLNGKKYFAVGEEIKIPREMEADEKVLRGRKDAQGAKAEYAQEQARIQAEREARRQQIAAENKIYKQLGLKNRKGAGTTIHDNKGNAYTVIGQAAFGRTIARKGKSIHVIAHDGVDLKTDYVVKDIENVKAGTKRIVVNGRAYYTDGAARDRHGRMNVTDWTGKKAILSGGKSKTDLSDRVILKNNYVEATDALDAGRGKKTYLDNGIQYVKSSDGKYWYFNEKGQAINAEQVEKQVAEKVAADLDDAADGWFFGAGTDEALMSKANAGISSPGILSKIEAHYQNKGFKANSEYKTAYEAFQGSELQRSEVYVNNAQLVKNNAIQDQSRRDEIISTNITEYGKTNENLQAGLDAIGNRTDFENANKAAQKYNQEKEYNPQFKNQSPINTLIYGQSDGDAESIRAANNKLIDPQENFLTSKEITRTLAEEGVYFLQEAKDHTIMKGLKDQDKEAALESNNADVYAMMDTLLKEKGEPSLKDTVDNARLATVGYGNFDADERAKLALDELMSSLNYTKSAESTPVGSMTMGTAFSSTASIMSDSKNAGLSINTLYKVLNSPESYKKFKELVNTNPDLKKYLTKIGFDESKLLFEAKSSNLSQDKIDNNKALVEVMRKAILQNRNEFQNITGQEGAIDSFLNRFRTTYGLGVTRETLSLLGQNSSYMLHNLELAAEGKLTDSKGTPISFEDYAKKLNISTQTMEEANVTYQTHQAYARMGLDVATTIATIPVGAGVVKILSTVANGVKTFKVVQTLDAAGKTVKEIGVVKKLADAQKLATTTAKAFLADSKAGQATIQVAQNLTSSSNIARSATMGLTNGTVMYGKERLNQVTSTQGDNMVARSEAENNFASNSAAAGVGFHVGAGVAPLDDLGAVGRALGAATEITSDAATSAAINYAQTGEAFVSKEDMATSIIFNVAGHTSIGKGHSKAPQVEPQGVLEHATGNGSHQSGGKLNPEKMDLARQQVADVAQHGTPQEVAHVQNEADLQQAQIRSQGKELKHVIEDNAGFVAIGKERIALDSSDFDALARAKKEVSNWTDGTRDKEAILAKINKRMDEINAGQVKPTEPARGVDVVEHINDKVNQNAEHILDGNTGAIGSHDAATLRDQLANNLKSEGEIEQFIADIKQRVGVDEKGNMHVYQVQGKDHAADLVNAAEKKLKDIRANKANFEEASSILDKANAAGKGLSEDELKTLKSVAGKMTDSESLQSLIDKMKSNKKIKGHSGAKKAIGEMEAQVQTLKKAEAGHVQKAQTAEEPQGASDGAVADFAAEQRRMIAEGKLNPEGTPIETQPKVKPDETPAAHNADEPQGVPAANAKRAQNDIPELSQAEINKLKGSDLGIRQMPDGTIIKTDKNGKTSIIGKLYDKAMHTKRKIVAGFSSTEKLLNASNREAHVKLLASLKDTYGDTKFTKDEINKILDNLPKNIDVKGKDLLGLTSLPDVHVDEAISILQKIDNPEKLQVLRALTDTNDRVWALSHKLSKVPDNEINYYEIENILENLQDSKVSDLGTLFQDAISFRYNRCFKENNSLASFLNTMSDKIKTDEQKQALYTILDKIDTYDDDLQMYSSELFDDIIPLIKNSQDVEILQDAFDNVDRFSSAKITFSIITGNIDEGNKQFLSSVLRTVRENNTKESSYNVYNLISTLSYSRSNENVTNNMILKMAKNKVALTDISNLVSIPNSDSSHLIYERLNNGKFDYDVGALAEIKYDNDVQKQAFSILLDKNSGNRFEALAIKDIIENIKDESSINLLNKLLQNKNNGAHTIIESLQNGRIIERPTGKLHSIVQNNDTMEQRILEILDIKNDTNSSITSYMDNLVKLNNASPKRFKKMLDSGLFDLIKEGKINARILENLDDNTFLSNRTLNDIRKIRNGEPIIKTLSSQTDLADISKCIANGDVCELNGKLYVNDNGTATQINLSKEKFEELFPPLTRVSFKQGQLGDCWFVSTLDNFMDLPNGRTSLYKLFEQQGDDILIKFPNSPNPIKFEGGKVLNAEGKQIQGFSQDEVPTGIRMIEQAYAIHRYYKYDNGVPVTEITSHATNVQGLMQELRGGWQYDAVNEILGNYNASIDSYGINLQNKNKMKEYIQQYANDENVLTFFATRDIPGGDTNMIAEEYDLAGRHAYSIKGYDKTTGMVYITNPWHTSVVTEIPLYELMKYIDDVNFAHFNKKEV